VLVILDRDGVINAYEEGQYVCSLAEWQPIPGSIEAIARLSRAGYRVAVATNQSGIARGYFSRAMVDGIHEHLQGLVQEQGGRIDYFAVCPHHPDEQCSCRKPETGLLREIQQHFGLSSLSGSWMLGDSRSDLEAALAASVKPVLVATGGGQATRASLDSEPLEGVELTDNLASFVETLLG